MTIVPNVEITENYQEEKISPVTFPFSYNSSSHC